MTCPTINPDLAEPQHGGSLTVHIDEGDEESNPCDDDEENYLSYMDVGKIIQDHRDADIQQQSNDRQQPTRRAHHL